MQDQVLDFYLTYQLKLIIMLHWMKSENMEVIGFYPYTSLVRNVIMEQNHNYITDNHDFIEVLSQEIKDKTLLKGVNWDNKVVVEVEIMDVFMNKSIRLFFGYKDGVRKIGLSVYQPDHYTKEYNLTFENLLFNLIS